MDGYLTVTEAAAALGVNVSTVRYRIARGQMQAERLGNQWVIPRAELARWHPPAARSTLARDLGSEHPADAYMTTRAAAERLGVTQIAVEQRILRGRLPARKVRGVYLVAAADVLAWADERARRGNAGE